MTYAPEVDPYAVEKNPILSNILAIVGFLIVAGVVGWGGVHLADLSRAAIASLFTGNPDIQITAPATTTADIPFTVSWSYATDTPGTYALLYQCGTGLSMQTPGPTGMTEVPCGAGFGIVGDSKSISLTPSLATGVSVASAPLSILFVSNATSSGVSTAHGETVLHVVVATDGTKSNTTTPVDQQATPNTSNTTNNTVAAKPVGSPDLTVRIAAISDAGPLQVATFTIKNQGTGSSGSYRFTAQIPGNPGYTYSSPIQSPLAPGAYVINTLRFSRTAYPFGSVLTVSVDPEHAVSESNEDNNTASRPLDSTGAQVVPTYQYQAPYPYNYQY